MRDLLEYIYTEVKQKRLSKQDAVDLISQVDNRYSTHRSSMLHPLLHQNNSDFSEQRFSSIFTGQEPFIMDYPGNNQRFLSGVAYLEMVRATMVESIGASPIEQNGFRFHHVWAQSMMFQDHPVQVQIGLFPNVQGTITYEIYTLEPKSGTTGEEVNERFIYSQGEVSTSAIVKVAPINIQEIQAHSSQRFLSAKEILTELKTEGIYTEPRIQGVNALYVCDSQVLVELSQPASVLNCINQMIFHPGIIDSAIQVAFSFIMGLTNLKPVMNFKIQDIEIFDPYHFPSWALVQFGNAKKAENDSQDDKFDIELCDEQGTIIARFIGYSPESTVEKPVTSSTLTSIPDDIRKLLLQVDWRAQAVGKKPVPDYLRHLVILCEVTKNPVKSIQENISNQLKNAGCLVLQSKLPRIDQRFQSYVTRIFEEIQTVFKDQLANKVLFQVVIPNQGEQQLFAGFTGLLRTARLENPKFIGQVIEVNPNEEFTEIITKLSENCSDPESIHIRYQDGKRWVSEWSELKATKEADSIPWRDGGVYLITGGAGGLGLLFANEITRRVSNTTLILTGRSPVSADKLSQIQVLEAKGARIIYQPVDVTDKTAVGNLMQSIRSDFGGLQGIIHAAGVIHDNYIIQKTKTEISKVLGPKVTGLVNLDDASRELDLDFLILFSSIAGSLGSRGQADYSAANAFMNAYAQYRNFLVASNMRKGRTISINWPLWKEGGMCLDQETENLVRQTTGLIPMETLTGMQALSQIWSSGKEQVLVLEGQLSLLQTIFLNHQTPSKTAKSSSSCKERRPELKGLNVAQCVEWDLKQSINKLLRIPREKIDKNKNLSEFGFTSLTLTQFAIMLMKLYGVEITPAMFFGYSTIEKITQFYLSEHQETIAKYYLEEESAFQTLTPPTVLAPIPIMKVSSQLLNKGFKTVMQANSSSEPIAVIGMSGRFAEARNIKEFWAILTEGRSSIREIPPERWDWRKFYGDPKQEPGKTNCKWCGCLPGVNEFEPLFFEISHREAECMDPRQRLLLQESWKALEDAGYGSNQIKSQKIGMFVGVEQGDYQEITHWQGGILANNNAVVAARLAYFLNLNGPVMAIDTACSSGLVAAHQAVVSLQAGECDTAITAGVTLLLTPGAFIGMGQAGMLSEDGKCYTFDKRANGMVPGEAVTALILKRLSKAEADGDPIYAVIKGSGINYDGKTNGITAPSGISQTNLLKMVYNQYQVNPEEIEYIVTHGTGTKLGDPVEINALYDAFKEYTKKQGYCALTSPKTNFGHTFGASGLLSLINLVLAVKNGVIPASLNCEQENDYINWKESPFYVNKNTQFWPNMKGKPRIGAVSAFGMTGTNAHMVVQSYSGTENQVIAKQAPYYLLVFSAKTEESLQEKVADMLRELEHGEITDLTQLSYTLMEGRQHFHYRCAAVVQDRENAIYVLKQTKSQERIPSLFQRKVSRDFVAQKGIEEYAFNLLKQCESLREDRPKYQETLLVLADLYCQGYALDWKLLFGEVKLQRLHLPTYPFLREHYWISGDQTESSILNKGISPITWLHPLLQQNTSDFSEQRYSSNFSGEEFFLKDILFDGQKVFPGMIYLELARAAITSAIGILTADQTGICLKDIKWSQSLTITEPVQIHIGLFPEEQGEISFEIYRSPENTETIIYNQGKATFISVRAVPNIDLGYFQTKCNQSALSTSEIYQELQELGLNYGPGYQGIETLYIGGEQALAKLVLPPVVSETRHQFILHPSMMEAVFQALLLFLLKSGTQNRLTVFSLQELELLKICTPSMWAVIKNSENRLGKKLDIEICDETGAVCVRLKNLEFVDENSLQVASVGDMEDERTNNKNILIQQEAYEMMTFEEAWQEEPSSESASTTSTKSILCFLSNLENQKAVKKVIQSYHQEMEVFFISQDTIFQKKSQIDYGILRTNPVSYQEALRTIQQDQKEVDAILYLWPLEDESCIEDYSGIVYLLQAIFALKLKPKRVLLAAQFSNGIQQSYAESWIGFERSLKMVLPNTQVAVIIQPGSELNQSVLKDWVDKLWNELHTPETKSILYQNGKRHGYQIRPIMQSVVNNQSPIKPGGTYLITGGCGGLGLLFAEHLVQQTKATQSVNLILTGRSILDNEKQSKIKVLEEQGSRVIYIQADLSNKAQMKKGINQAKEKFGAINGIIYAAGLAGSQSIFQKKLSSFLDVINPKIDGTIVLDELLESEPLDFVCYFSSSAAILGDFGSCDYAVANRFLMAYAHYRNQQQLKGEKQGKAVVINWPLWKEGGMGVRDVKDAAMYLKSSGQKILETNEGLAVFDRIMAQHIPITGITQHLVILGQPSRVNRFLGLTKGQPIFTQENSVLLKTLRTQSQGRRPELMGLSIEQCVTRDLQEQISHLLKIPQNKLDHQENLANFGFDSISLADLASQLTRYYQIEITPALFFGYSTIARLTQYFITEHAAVIQEFYHKESEMVEQETTITSLTAPVLRNQPKLRTKKTRFNPTGANKVPAEPIAIIGMSGRFPGANNIAELWDNLVSGRNCITEIPPERWDWRDYCGDPHHESNKTNSKWGGFISDIDCFEPLFFEISPREAELMDPKQRLFLEEAWRCFEDAGYTGERLKGKLCGVYAGVEESEYAFLSGDGLINSNQNAALPARIAYKLDLKGPNLALTAACSSGLVAIHQACQALRQDDCEMALAGGVNLLLTPLTHIGMSQANMLSPDGESYVFDQRANGMVPSEAVAVVLLKPLSKAIKDQDHIYGCIKASGVNYNGKGNGIIAPNLLSQAELIQKVYEKYHIDPSDIQYVIPHSVGSKLGDSIEIQALTNSFSKYSTQKQYCTIGSVKPLIGHTFAASGVVSLIAMLLAIKNQTMLGLHNYESSNEYISFIESPFIPYNENQYWLTKNNQPRIGAISTTGISGTNAHAVIEEYLPSQRETVSLCLKPQIVVLSAKNKERLSVVAQQLLKFVEKHQDFSLTDLAYTLQVGREAMPSRLAMVIKNKDELIQGLKAFQTVAENDKIKNSQLFYVGDLESNDSNLIDFLSGKIEDTIVELLMKENNFEKLAHYWTQGGKIPWEILHTGNEVHRIPVPTYPFARERYWYSSRHPEQHQEVIVQETRESKKEFIIQSQKPTVENIRDYICSVLFHELKLPVENIKFNKSFLDYGVDSIVSLKLIHDLKEMYQLNLSGREVLEYPTIESFAKHLADILDGAESVIKESSNPVIESSQQKTTMKYPLSEVQQGLWVIQEFSPQNNAYNVPIAVRVKSRMEPTSFKKACEYTLQQFPILNTKFIEENGVPFQIIDSNREIEFHQENIAHLKDEEITLFIREIAKKPFRLSTSPLVRFYLFNRSEQDFIILIVIHHILTDGTSQLLFTKRLWNAYFEFLQNKEPEIDPVSVTYEDFIKWEQKMLNGPEGETHLNYWKKRLSGEVFPVMLPTDRSRSSVPSLQGFTYETKISQELSRKIRDFAKLEQVSFATIFLGIYKVILYKYTGQTDITIGMPTIGRPQRRFDSVMGMFINMALIRSQLSVECSFIDFLKELRLTVIDGVYHADYPFPVLVRYFKENHNIDITTLARINFTYQSYVRPFSFDSFKIEQNQFVLESIAGIQQEGTEEFGVEIYENDDNFIINFKYHIDLFDAATIERMARHYMLLIEKIITEPGKTIESYDMVSEGEKELIINDWSHKEVLYPKDKCIHQLFEAQAQKHAEQIAVTYAGNKITYRELNQESTKLAAYLQTQGINPGNLVGIYMDRSAEMIIGVLGILKAGGAYVPLAANYPEDRIKYMLEDSSINILITQERLRNKINEIIGDNHYQIINIDKDLDHLENTENSLKRKVKPEDLAYVIYTSGSTGKPKGVMVNHGNLVNAFYAWQDAYELSSNDVHLQMAAFSFDVFAGDWTRALCSGAKLVICPHEWLLDPENLYKLMQQEQISCAEFVPAVLRALIRYLEKEKKDLAFMRLLIAGSDIWYVKEYQEFQKYCGPQTRLINSYGLTEATIDSTFFEGTSIELSSERYIPIGRPFANTYIYILDCYLRPVPVGVPGELFVGGAGVVHGYLNRPELTNERFIDNPFQSGTRIYKTGDLAKWLPDENIEFMGRADHQVKVRGFRIELGEIENQLTNFAEIKEAVVVTRGDNEGNAFLVAYIVCGENEVNIESIKLALGSRLPEYMVPTVIIKIDKLPLSPNGKVDKKALMNMKIEANSNRKFIAPSNEIEKILAEIFNEVLNMEKISITDNFFELGGHSLLVVKALYLIKEKLERKINVRDFYSYSTVSELGKFIQEGGNGDQKIDLKKEAILEDDIRPCQNNLSISHYQNILLTGCTGFVGRFLFHELLNKTDLTIYCLVRAGSTNQAIERIKESLSEFELWKPVYRKRILPIIGDLSKPEFGMEKNQYLDLCNTIDMIYHCATYMNHLATYQEMKNANVEGTKWILRFACTNRQKPIQYISSLGIFNMNQTRKIDEKTSLENETHYNSTGYNSSKWVAEKLMLIAQERGIPNNIFRLGLVTGDSQKGRCDKSQLFYMHLQSYLEVGYVGYDSIDTKIWITPVDFIAKAIVYLARHPELNQTYLLVNNQAINYIDLIKFYNINAEKPLQIVSSVEYFQKIKEYVKEGKTLPIVPMLQDILNLTEEEIKVIQQKLGEADISPTIEFDSSQTLSLLNEGGIKIPKVNALLVKRYFDYIARNILTL